jgi:hypothetical protein
MLTLKQEPDETKCDHSSLLNTPSRTKGDLIYGLCADCKEQIVMKLDKSGKPTDMSWIYKIVESADCTAD